MPTHDNYDLILTRDGTYTLRSKEYDETMHSASGAYEEALLKHVRPSGILNSTAPTRYVLDVGFGLGYNILALLTELGKKNIGGPIEIISMEKDRSLISLIDRIIFKDERDGIYALIKQAYAHGAARNKNTNIKIIFGDGRDTIKSISGVSFDAVFFDPFSPAKNPELWSVEFFKEIFRIMKDSGILTTYSSAVQVRAALIEAGFVIGSGPAVGGKREGTLAAKTGNIDPLSEAELMALSRDPRAAPYRDRELTDEPSAIRERRREEIRERKQKRG